MGIKANKIQFSQCPKSLSSSVTSQFCSCHHRIGGDINVVATGSGKCECKGHEIEREGQGCPIQKRLEAVGKGIDQGEWKVGEVSAEKTCVSRKSLENIISNQVSQIVFCEEGH